LRSGTVLKRKVFEFSSTAKGLAIVYMKVDRVKEAQTGEAGLRVAIPCHWHYLNAHRDQFAGWHHKIAGLSIGSIKNLDRMPEGQTSRRSGNWVELRKLLARLGIR